MNRLEQHIREVRELLAIMQANYNCTNSAYWRRRAEHYARELERLQALAR